MPPSSGDSVDFQSVVILNDDGTQGRSVAIQCSCGEVHYLGLTAVDYRTFRIQYYCLTVRRRYDIVPDEQTTNVYVSILKS